MNKFIKSIDKIPFQWHLVISFAIRFGIIIWGEWFDSFSEVPYTDIDYRVVSDGARHIWQNNNSPYLRHTYRYSPIFAMLMIPNLLFNIPWFGKIIFCIFDIIVGVLIENIVYHEYKTIWKHNCDAIQNRYVSGVSRQQAAAAAAAVKKEMIMPSKYETNAKLAAIVWLYNPLAIGISTRGNGDSITSALILATIYFLMQQKQSFKQYFYAGLVHGLAIHLRLYPLAFSLTYFIYASGPEIRNLISILFEPNRKKIALVLGTLISLGVTVVTFYQQYGYEFLYETYIYHLVRKDTRHNFSLYFYMQYLNANNADESTALASIEKWIQFGPQLIILLLTCLKFGRNSKTLSFAIFLQTFTMVTFNPVVTSQYFIWFLSLLPLCLKNLQKINLKTAIVYVLLWLLTQGAWLLPAYLLEFKGWNTFSLIWMQSVMFFCANMFIMQRLIINFNVIADFRIKDL